MQTEDLIEFELTRSVIGAFYEVYNTLGHGFLEVLYVRAMERELYRRGHVIQRELSVDVLYKGDLLGTHRIDMLVDGKLIVEIKAAGGAAKPALRQLQSYLRATTIDVGLVLLFGVEPAFHRLVCSANSTSKGGTATA